MKFLLLTVWLPFVFIPGLSSAENLKNNSGSVYGYVYNGSAAYISSDDSKVSRNKSGVAGQKVVLYRYVDGQQVEEPRPHTVTDAEGRFQFTGLEVGARFAYYPVAVFEDIEYYGKVVTIQADSARKRSDVLVFESTASDSNILVGTHHIIIKPGLGALNVREYYFFANQGRHTYVGTLPAGPPNKNIVLQIEVPENATELNFGGDLMSCCAVVTDHYIFDTMEFKPGMRQIVINYLLPYTGREASLIKKISHPTAEIDVFLPENTGNLTAPNLTTQPAFEIRGQMFRRFKGTNLTKGSMLFLGFTELPATAPDWRWLAPVILVVLIVAVYGAHRWRKSNRSMEKSEDALQEGPNAKERRRLLNEILLLDETFEAGTIDANTYYKTREELEHLVFELDAESQKTDASELKKQEIENDEAR
jgi:hypothetical protein